MKKYTWMLCVILLVSSHALFPMSQQEQNALNQEFFTAIKHLSDYDKPLQALQKIVGKGADVTAVDENGRSAVALAVVRRYNNPSLLDSVLKVLVQHGADVNARQVDFLYNDTPLISLLNNDELRDNQKLTNLKVLIQYGADVTLPQKLNERVFHELQDELDLDEADIEHARSKNNFTPLMLVEDNVKLARMVRDRGGNMLYDLNQEKSVAEYLKKFDQGLASFLSNPTELVDSDFSYDFFREHMKNALKSKNYNPERIARYKKIQQREQAQQSHFTDVAIFISE